MAKKLYVPVNGLSKEIKKFYVSVNGVSKKVKKAYVNVGGLSKLFFDGSSVPNFWFFYKTANNDVLITQIQNQGDTELTWNKFNNSITFFALLHYEGYTYDYVLVLSTDPDGITCGRSSYISDTGTVTYNNETWYWGFCNNVVWHNSYYLAPIGCRLPDYPNQATMRTQGIQDVLAKIYTGDFAENYQVGQTYNLKIADIGKTIRKAIAIFLFRCVDLKNLTHYQVLLQNIDDFVNDLISHAEGSKIIDFWIFRGYGDIIQLTAYYSSATSADNKQITRYSSSYYFYNYTYSSEIQADKGYRIITIASDGTITRDGRSSYTGNIRNYIGIKIDKSTVSGTVYTTISLSNVGLKFNPKEIYSSFYPNADVYDAGIVAQTNGGRSPVTKRNDGDSVVFISKNASTWDNKWIYTCCIALTYDAAILDAPSEGLNVSTHVINGTTYYFSLHTGHPNYDGATQVTTPIGVPIFDELFICNPNTSPTTQRVAEIIDLLGIETA